MLLVSYIHLDILKIALPLVVIEIFCLTQALEWNDEPTEEHGVGESPPDGTDDVCTLNSEKKEDNVVIGNEETEWDRLLRVR